MEKAFLEGLASFELMGDAALKLSDVIEASCLYYETASDWPARPDDIKGVYLAPE